MTGVVFVFVREDASEAEALAEAFDAAGFSITGNSSDKGALSVVVWSRHAVRSEAFRAAAERALRAGRAVVASLSTPPPAAAVFGAPAVDLTAWDGTDGADLDPLFEAVDAIVRPVRSNVIELPSRPVYEDAEFVEAPQLAGGESERERRARLSWEAPIPDHMLRPVRDVAMAAPRPKRGAPSPRRDFPRLHEVHPRAHATFAIAALALIGSGVLAMSFVRASSPAPLVAAAAPQPASASVSLTSASAEAVGLDDVAVIEPAPPAPRTSRAESPSARTIRRATHRAVRSDRRAYRPPSLIPESVVADLQRDESPRG